MKKILAIFFSMALLFSSVSAVMADDYEDDDAKKFIKKLETKIDDLKKNDINSKIAGKAMGEIEKLFEKANKEKKEEEWNAAAYYCLKANAWIEIIAYKMKVEQKFSEYKTTTGKNK